MTTENEGIISIRDAARLCGRNTETVRRWVWSGKLSAQKLGNQLFVRQADLAQFCQELAPASDAPPKLDILDRVIALQNRMKARGIKPSNTTTMVRDNRDERMNQIGKSMY